MIRPTTRLPARPSDTDELVRRGYDPITGFGRVNAVDALAELETLLLGAGAAAAGVANSGQEFGAPSTGTVPTSIVELLEDQQFTVTEFISSNAIADLVTGQSSAIGDLLRLNFTPLPEDFGPAVASFDFNADEVGALADLDFSGDLVAELLPQFQFDFGFDGAGFFFGTGTLLDTALSATAAANGMFAGLSAEAVGSVTATPRLALAPADRDADGKIRLTEFLQNVTELSVELEEVAATLAIDLTIDLLDYVDADGDSGNNSIHGGDPFRFAASTTLNGVAVGENGFEFQWNGIDIHNPDVDGDGQDDFTSEVLVENARLLIQDVIRGERTELADQLGLALSNTSLVATGGSFGQATDIAATLADYLVSNTEIIDVVSFDTVESWLNGGVPTEIDEIIRLKTDLGQIPIEIVDTVQVSLAELLPGAEVTGGVAGFENARIDGQLVFGFDTFADPFYLLVAPDDTSPNEQTELNASIDLFASADSLTIGGDLLELSNVNAVIRPTATFGFENQGDSKLRLSQVGTAGVDVTTSLDGTSDSTLAADALRFFPDEESDNFQASADLVSGSIDLETGATELQAMRASVAVGKSIEVVTNDVSIGFDPAVTASDAVLATIGSSTIRFPEYPGLPAIDLQGLTIRRDGFSIDSFSSEFAGAELVSSALLGLATAAEGEESFSVSGRVWFDSDGDSAATGEFGVAGQIVKLFDASEGALVAETVTNDQGEYQFSVETGFYYVEFGLTSESAVFVSPNQGTESVDSDVLTGARTESFVVVANETNLSDAGIRNTIHRPVLIVPGIVGTLAKNVSTGDNYMDWLLHRGIHPDKIESDPLTRVYDDLFQTLDNVGYTPNEDLFVVTYDWRVLPGPKDGVIDGRISGLTAEGLVDAEFTYGADYLGYFLDQAAQRWEANHPGETLDSVDIIAHSTGGLVTRAYIQSDAYGGPYQRDNQESRNLPLIHDFYSMGVPHRGAPKAWNPLHNNVKTDVAFRAVVSKIINAALLKIQNGEVILGPSGLANGEDAITLAKLEEMEGNLETNFIRTYVPTTKALLATYDFLTDVNGNPVDINSDLQFADLRNSLALDLNAGLDATLVGDPNAFVDELLGSLVVIAGISEDTLRTVKTHVGDELVERQFPTTHLFNPNPAEIVEMSDFLARAPHQEKLGSKTLPKLAVVTAPCRSFHRWDSFNQISQELCKVRLFSLRLCGRKRPIATGKWLKLNQRRDTCL